MSHDPKKVARVMKFLRRKEESIPRMVQEVTEVMTRWGVWGRDGEGDLGSQAESMLRHHSIDMWREGVTWAVRYWGKSCTQAALTRLEGEDWFAATYAMALDEILERYGDEGEEFRS